MSNFAPRDIAPDPGNPIAGKIHGQND